MAATEVTLLIQGLPRTFVGERKVEVFWNGDHVGDIAKGATERIVLASGGALEFVTKTPMAGTKRFSMNVESGDRLELQAKIDYAQFTVGPPRKPLQFFVGGSVPLD